MGSGKQEREKEQEDRNVEEEYRRRRAIALDYKEQQSQIFKRIHLLAKEHWINCLQRLWRPSDKEKDCAASASIEQKTAHLNEVFGLKIILL